MRILLFFAFAALTITNNKAFADDEVIPVWTAAESTGRFSDNFSKTVARNNLGNSVFSPFSVQIALSMLAYGATGTTADLLRSVLVLPADDQLGQTSLKALYETFNITQGIELRLANTMFTSSTIPVKDAYKQLIASVFSSTIQELDFRNGEAAAGTINTWCEQETNGLIKDILLPADIMPNTLLVLVNAIYFRGNWDKPFDAYRTVDKPFYIDAQTTRNVSTMHISSEFRTGDLPGLDARFIEIPYKGKEMSMIIVLPFANDGLSALVNNIDQLNLTYHLDHSLPIQVYLRLPKFEIGTKLDLKRTLEQLGLSEIFDDRADFSGIINSPTKVTKVVQKAFIKVDETGSEAAAASNNLTNIESAKRACPYDRSSCTKTLTGATERSPNSSSQKCHPECPEPKRPLQPEEFCPELGKFKPPPPPQCCFIRMQDPCAPCCCPPPKKCEDECRPGPKRDPICGCDLCQRGICPDGKCCGPTEPSCKKGLRDPTHLEKA